jgi:transposase-like protein
MIQKRRRHTKEFKEQAVKLVTEKGYSVSEAMTSKQHLFGLLKENMESLSRLNGGKGVSKNKIALC